MRLEDFSLFKDIVLEFVMAVFVEVGGVEGYGDGYGGDEDS
jgi:hypothetical protein